MAADRESSSGVAPRDRIANKVIYWSGLGILLVSLVSLTVSVVPIIWSPGANTPGAAAIPDARNAAQQIFNALIPLFGTWVGTVLAFYFSRENFEAAAKSTHETMRLSDERLKQISVKDAWIDASAIEGVAFEDGKESAVKFDSICEKLTSKVTRVPAWIGNKIVKYILHESVIYKYLYALRRDVEAAAEEADKAPNDAAKAAAVTAAKDRMVNATLQTFLQWKDQQGNLMRDMVTKIGWIAQDATLADAKAKMEAIEGCQDVLVTPTGSPTESILGWLTNADIAKKAKIN